MKTKLLMIATGVFIRRDDSAIDVLTTGDGEAVSKDESNVLTRNRVSVEQFSDVVNGVAPEAKGALVNVGTKDIPLLLTQSQAPRYQALLAAAGDPSSLGELVNVGGDDDTLLLTKAQVERFAAITERAIGAATTERELEVRTQIAADTAAEKQRQANARINVGADYGLELLLSPGDAATFQAILGSAVDAAVSKVRDSAPA